VVGFGFGFGFGSVAGTGLGTLYVYSEVVPALGTPPMMKCGKQMYSWLENRRRQRESSRAFALPAAGGCSAPG
jgi:hypothetical protein